jgi:ClpP class serine protease
MRLFPLARIVVLVPILFIPLFIEVYAFAFIGLWFLLQLFGSAAELLQPSSSGGVAWWARYIDINDSEDVLRAVQMTDVDVPIDLVLHTPGGLVLAALQIAKAVRGHKAKVTVFVPHYAMSGGTLIALAADEIVMCEHLVLGPIDPQLGESPAASLIKATADKPVAKIEDRTLILADVGRKAIAQVKQAASELLTRRLPAEKASALAEQLTSGTWTHDYPIWASTAKSLGLSVSTNMPDDVLQLLKLYPQPVRMQSSGGVEYLPVERRSSGGSEVGSAGWNSVR